LNVDLKIWLISLSRKGCRLKSKLCGFSMDKRTKGGRSWTRKLYNNNHIGYQRDFNSNSHLPANKFWNAFVFIIKERKVVFGFCTDFNLFGSNEERFKHKPGKIRNTLQEILGAELQNLRY
jgi:hypothetical protein